MGKRIRVTPTDDWRQVELLTRSPEQRAYELIRPVVLFGRSPAERAQETGAAERTLYRQADRFDQFGMQGLCTPVKVEQHRRIPEEIRRLCWPFTPSGMIFWQSECKSARMRLRME